jgi:hypothetical protein
LIQADQVQCVLTRVDANSSHSDSVCLLQHGSMYQNAYHDHGDDFEHGVRSEEARFSGSHAERLAEGLSSQRGVARLAHISMAAAALL